MKITWFLLACYCIICYIYIIVKRLNTTCMDTVCDGKNNFKRAYGVAEFAQLYFPGRTPVVAYKRMWEWIRTSRGLKAKLEAAGWVKFQKLYTPRQVAVLIDHLDQP